jgi:DNA-binding IclR family transcriptional regulator
LANGFSTKVGAVDEQGGTNGMEQETQIAATGSGGSGRIATNLRMLLILEVVGNSDRSMSPTEINKGLGLPKQSIHRLCATLVSEGFLAYDSSRKRLRPALRLRKMASRVLYSSSLHIVRHQILEEVAATVGETVNFVVPEEKGMSYLDRVDTDWPFRVQLPIGTHVPFHCTASGKTFLASLPDKKRSVLLDSLQLERHTDKTITNRERLAVELREISRNGYALDREEFMEGMMAIAVPVVDNESRYIASIAFHGPTVRLDEQTLLSHRRYLSNAARRLANVIIEE